MLQKVLPLLFCFFLLNSFSQQTEVFGKIIDKETKKALPFVKIKFKNSKIGTISDSSGNYSLSTYYATDTLLFILPSYKYLRKKIKLDARQEINVVLETALTEINEVVVRPPDELPSTILHKKIIANKPINNKTKLLSYEYEAYSKLQLDLNNIDTSFKDNSIVKHFDFILDYLDTSNSQKKFLPLFLSESISDFHYTKDPKQKLEVIKASKTTGMQRVQVTDLVGDIYLDVNFYENFIPIVQKDFVSPLANTARNFYRFYLDDSMFIDKKWCYKMRFIPRRYGDLTFEGEMYIHDTTYAVKEIKAKISPGANINYLQDLYIKQQFQQVDKEVWMMTHEETLADLKVSKKSELYGFFARKTSSRKNFVINQPRPTSFFNENKQVIINEDAKSKDSSYWNENRHLKITKQEAKITEMADSLNKTPFFVALKKIPYLLGTGYYEQGKLEYGSLYGLISTNPVEKIRIGFSLRTSQYFSKQLRLMGNLAYGFKDHRLKYGAGISYKTKNPQRTVYSIYGKSDLDQIGMADGASLIGSTFNTIFRTGALDKITFEDRFGIAIEKDFGKDFVIKLSTDLRRITPLGIATFEKLNNGSKENLENIQTNEIGFNLRFCKDEEYVNGIFERRNIKNKNPIFNLKSVIGLKNILGSQFDYQKIELQMQQFRNIGSFGRMDYLIKAGKVFGDVPYPLLKVHEGNQSYWLETKSFNLLNYYEFVSDTYVTGIFEQKWGGFIFNYLPLIQKLKLRLVSSMKMTYGTLSDNSIRSYQIPKFVRSFNKIPYTELSVGLENIAQFFRVDVIWRMTHNEGAKFPIGVRGLWTISF